VAGCASSYNCLAGKRPKRGPLWGGVQDDNKSWVPSGNDNATQAAFAFPLRQNRILLIDTVVRRGGEATVGLMTVLDFGRGPREFGAGCDQRGSFEPTKIRLAAVFGDFICFENGHRSEYLFTCFVQWNIVRYAFTGGQGHRRFSHSASW
jgi:hypothetical protein